jgi:hypothetical protein
LAPGLGSAHGNDTTADDAPPYEGADDWATWMEDHMTDHMGPDAVEWMEANMGVTIDEMAQDHTDEDPDRGMHEQGYADDYNRGTHGQGHC